MIFVEEKAISKGTAGLKMKLIQRQERRRARIKAKAKAKEAERRAKVERSSSREQASTAGKSAPRRMANGARSNGEKTMGRET